MCYWLLSLGVDEIKGEPYRHPGKILGCGSDLQSQSEKAPAMHISTKASVTTDAGKVAATTTA